MAHSRSPRLAPGTYTLRVEVQGFKKVLVPQVIVEVGTTASVNVTLEVGTVSEEVTVAASEAQEIVNTTNAQIGDVVDRRRILDLPLDGRNPLDLATLQAGADETGRVKRRTAPGVERDTSTALTLPIISISPSAAC
jgi:hypothetical protein